MISTPGGWRAAGELMRSNAWRAQARADLGEQARTDDDVIGVALEPNRNDLCLLRLRRHGADCVTA